MDKVMKLAPQIQTGIEKLEALSLSVIIEDVKGREYVLDILKDIKARDKDVIEYLAVDKKKKYDEYKAVVTEEKYFTDKLRKAEGVFKSAVLKYDREQAEIRRVEQAKLQAIADEQARKERERLEKQAAKLKTPELAQERLEQAQQIIAPVVQVAQEAPKVEGVSKRVNWKWREVDRELIPREYMIPNEKMLNGTATSQKGAVKVPGIEFYSEESLSIKF